MSRTGIQDASHYNAPPFLIWEDAEPDPAPGAEQWWLARASDASPIGPRDFFIAEDDVSGYVVGIVRPRPDKSAKAEFRVIAATLRSEVLHLTDAVAVVKEQITGWLVAPREAVTRHGVSRWRRRRRWIIARANLPLAAGAFFIGAFLGFAVAMFAVSSGLVGYPMLVAGLSIGAIAGWCLKMIADRKPDAATSPALVGSWGRFAVVTIAALVGAGLASGSILTLFWS